MAVGLYGADESIRLEFLLVPGAHRPAAGDPGGALYCPIYPRPSARYAGLAGSLSGAHPTGTHHPRTPARPGGRVASASPPGAPAHPASGPGPVGAATLPLAQLHPG